MDDKRKYYQFEIEYQWGTRKTGLFLASSEEEARKLLAPEHQKTAKLCSTLPRSGMTGNLYSVDNLR